MGEPFPVSRTRRSVLVRLRVAENGLGETLDDIDLGHHDGRASPNRTRSSRKLAQMNADGGYWIAEACPEAGRRAVVRSWPISDVHAVLAVTDGVSCGVDDYGISASWPAALDLARREGLDVLLDTVRQAEARDPDARRWPRSKTHDDKAATLILFDEASG